MSAPRVRHAAGFWIIAVTFLLVMAYSTVPTPLYPLYQQRDGFPAFTITIVFAAYAIGVMISLYLFGHVSDWVGRRRVLLVAVLLSALSALMFVFWSDVPGLIVARLVNGASIGILTATATAHLGELRSVARPTENSIVAASVSGAANLGGLALGPLIGGVFADLLPDPLMLPHVVFLVILLLAAVTLQLVPETVDIPADPPRWRPQRISIPPRSRRRFVIAAFGAFSGFAVFGLFTSLAPTFLVTTFQQGDHLLAGATTFSVFAAAALGQIVLAGVRLRIQLTVAVIGCAVGLVGVAIGAVTPALALFLVGGVVAGLGVGLLFKGAIGTAVAVADPARKGESLALMFLIAYAGLALPALVIGAVLLIEPPTPVLLSFVAVVLATTVSAGLLMRRAAR
ncbi:MFS transporter [Herbiconiux sp. CPCC 203407]|uniref:MFS transporter n=1 Tax=Herbiconiux oxytropis TaxID=2970915 RepID=A0AA41XD64_9MICO|nr:MFS transporter [Herbiconiux oxytropis]MCS5723787.1 MFS transporter [Herbiconiux oxytropis]MCS5725882.1 MFS transporter [Herbiconiux oxytropis]